MKFEIEVLSSDATSEIFDLRDFLLQSDMQSFNVQLKDQAPMEGEMSIALTAATVIGEKMLDIALDKCFGMVLEDRVRSWLEKRNKKNDSKIEVVTSIISEKEKIHYVTNSEGKTKPIDRNFTLMAQNTTAVVIGNSEFENGFPKIGPVNGNVEQIYKVLSSKSIFNIPKENIKVLLNKTSVEIEEELLKESRKNNLETFIVYYAGHGYRSSPTKLHLISKNTKKVGDHIIGGIDFDFIKSSVLNGATANNKIVLLDACHSGVAAQGEDSELLDTTNVKGSYILASSSADEVSYFNSDHSMTYFTNELINIFTGGLPNDKELLSIDDLYENLEINLKAKKLPVPRYKSELSIKPANFLLASNVQYNSNTIITRAKNYLSEGRLEDALQLFNKLHLKYPTDEDIKSDLEACRNAILFNRYVEDGDKFYFEKKDYKAALNAYTNANSIKNDYSITTKIKKCNDLIRTKSNDPGPAASEQPKNDAQQTQTDAQTPITPEPPSNPDTHQKRIGETEILLTYLAATVGAFLPLANFFLLPYSIVMGYRWWKLKISGNPEVNRYNETAQKHGKTIFIIALSLFTLLILIFINAGIR